MHILPILQFMTNKEAAEYMVRDFEDFRDLLSGIANTHPEEKRAKRAASRYVIALAADEKSKATIVVSHGEVTAFHASELDEDSQKWNKTTINFGSKFNPNAIPVQIQYHESVHEPRVGIPVDSIEVIPQEISERLYGAVALFCTT